jgi:hypothetical protein
MVRIDQQLLFAARKLVNGANVHQLSGLIFHYEQAVLLHNKQWERHVRYDPGPESALRGFVARQQRRMPLRGAHAEKL